MKARQLLREAEKLLRAAGTEDPGWDARQLLSEVMNTAPLLLSVQDREVEPREEAAFRTLLTRRAGREPLQYILGVQYFMDLPFRVTPDVLIPRFDTEAMCEDAVKRLPPRARVLDLCTGSGALAVAVARLRPDTEVTASDLSEAALRVARQNALENGARVTFTQGDLFAPLAGQRFDALLSNPPYIPDGELPSLPEEVKREPKMALGGGTDGLDFYRRIISRAPEQLAPGGLIWLETGDGEAPAVLELLRGAFTEFFTGQDLSGRDRWVRARLAP